MNNLFSVFEPHSFLSLPLNWASSAIVLIFLFPPFWKRLNITFFSLSTLKTYLVGELKAVFANWSPSNGLIIPCVLLFRIFLNNFLGLFPYIFTSSRHLIFTVSISLPLWTGHIIIGWVKTPRNMLAHLVPLGTPAVLMPFIVLIELTRSLIRPLTLSVRLAANMIAGHLLLRLLGSSSVSASYAIITLVIAALIALRVLELGVSLIQAYVFRVLSTLYFNEIERPKLYLFNKLIKLKAFKVLNSNKVLYIFYFQYFKSTICITFKR